MQLILCFFFFILSNYFVSEGSGEGVTKIKHLKMHKFRNALFYFRQNKLIISSIYSKWHFSSKKIEASTLSQ